MHQELSQKDWLTLAKRNLSALRGELTWDEFAHLSGVEPRTFKTYRMPDDSSNSRKMPGWVREAIEALLNEAPENKDSGDVYEEQYAVLIPALAALVIRQAHVSLIDGRMIAGTNQQPNIPVGLTHEDRRAMSLVSVACLKNGLLDYGSEIHRLLGMCTHPLGTWLTVPEVEKNGMARTSLIHPDDGVPTVEAEELAADFPGITTQLENQLFHSFLEKLSVFPEKKAYLYYTRVRENIVRYPMIHTDNMQTLTKNLPSVIGVTIQQSFYEPVPDGWQIDGKVPLCAHCGNAMKPGKAGLLCRTAACRSSLDASVGTSHPAMELLRVNRGVKQYWVEPGFDEIRLYDDLQAAGIEAELYPKRDLVDVAVDDVGIDLKAYSSPETLGRKFNRGLGGLAHYRRKWVVVPDALAKQVPAYMDRLKNTITNNNLVCLTRSEALSILTSENIGKN